jgi:Tfp pilus assembly protein PilO
VSSLGSRRSILFLYLISALIMVVVYLYFVAPAEQKRDDILHDFALAKGTVNGMQSTISTKADRGTGSKLLIELAKLRVQIPEEANVDSLLRDFRMLETVTKLRMTSYSLESSAAQKISTADSKADDMAKSLYVPIHLDTTVKGTYEQIYRLLQEIQTMPRLMTVEKLTLISPTSSKVKLNEPNREITCNLTLSAYYAPSLQNLIKTVSPLEYAKPAGHKNPFN